MKLSEVMKRASFIRGNSMVIFSISYSDIAEVKDMVTIDRYIQNIIEKMPKKSMLLMLDTRRLSVNDEINRHMKEVFVRYSPYFKSSAVVVDVESEKVIKGIAKDLGFTKMNMYADLESARKSLFGGENAGKYVS